MDVSPELRRVKEEVEADLLARPGVNPGAGDHFYTTSFEELRHGQHGWGYERVGCYVLPTAGLMTADRADLSPQATVSDLSPQATVSDGEDAPATFSAGRTSWVQPAEADRPETFTVTPCALDAAYSGFDAFRPTPLLPAPS